MITLGATRARRVPANPPCKYVRPFARLATRYCLLPTPSSTHPVRVTTCMSRPYPVTRYTNTHEHSKTGKARQTRHDTRVTYTGSIQHTQVCGQASRAQDMRHILHPRASHQQALMPQCVWSTAYARSCRNSTACHRVRGLDSRGCSSSQTCESARRVRLAPPLATLAASLHLNARKGKGRGGHTSGFGLQQRSETLLVCPACWNSSSGGPSSVSSLLCSNTHISELLLHHRSMRNSSLCASRVLRHRVVSLCCVPRRVRPAQLYTCMARAYTRVGAECHGWKGMWDEKNQFDADTANVEHCHLAVCAA